MLRDGLDRPRGCSLDIAGVITCDKSECHVSHDQSDAPLQIGIGTKAEYDISYDTSYISCLTWGMQPTTTEGGDRDRR